ISASLSTCFAAAIASKLTLRNTPSCDSPTTKIFSLMSNLLSNIRFYSTFASFFNSPLVLSLGLLHHLLKYSLLVFQVVRKYQLFLFSLPHHLHLNLSHQFQALLKASSSLS